MPRSCRFGGRCDANGSPEPPVPIIFDTDMSIDVDDVGALCALHGLVDSNEAELLAVVRTPHSGSNSTLAGSGVRSRDLSTC